VLRELKGIPELKRTARFVCVLAAARDGQTLHTFRGAAEGIILDAPRGKNGFGYDPLSFPSDWQDVCRTNRRRKIPLQAIVERLSRISGVVSRKLTRQPAPFTLDK